jgi:hypothetical protein
VLCDVVAARTLALGGDADLRRRRAHGVHRPCGSRVAAATSGVAEPSQGVNLSLGALMRLVAFLEAGELLIEKTRRAAR